MSGHRTDAVQPSKGGVNKRPRRHGWTRRRLLRGAAAAGTAAAVGPWIVRDARSSSGSLTVMTWSDYLPAPLVERFERQTGIKIKHLPYGSNAELLNRVKASRGRGVDLVSPTNDRKPQWRDLDLLRPWDMNRVPVDRITKSTLDISLSQFSWDGGNYLIPFVWGTEGLAWRTDKWTRQPEDLSYGDLFLPEMKGRIMGRAYSMMTGIGLYLDHSGKMGSNRMLDAYRDEESMRRVWDKLTKVAIEHKQWVKLLWDDAETQVNGFLRNGVVLGQTWDGPATRLRNDGQPIAYQAPKEGALAWLDGLALTAEAKNVEQAYAFIDFIYQAKTGALLTNETGYHSVSVGSFDLLSPQVRDGFRQSYPGDALNQLWWWPPTPVWYARLRAEYQDKFIGA
jgi:spermidine/putrescine transport system substrate-binding protein